MNQKTYNTEQQSRIGSRLWGNPEIGARRCFTPPGVHDQKPCATPLRLFNSLPVLQMGNRGVVPPNQDRFRLFEMRRGQTHSVSISGTGIPAPLAHMRRGNEVRAAKTIRQPDRPRSPIGGVTAARRGSGKRDAFGTALCLDLQKPARRFGQRFVPTDSHPARIGRAFWVGAFHGELQSSLVVNDLRRGFGFHAKTAIGVALINPD